MDVICGIAHIIGRQLHKPNKTTRIVTQGDPSIVKYPKTNKPRPMGEEGHMWKPNLLKFKHVN